MRFPRAMHAKDTTLYTDEPHWRIVATQFSEYSSMDLAAYCNCKMCPCVEDTMISSSESVLSSYKARSGIPGGLAIAAWPMLPVKIAREGRSTHLQ